MFISADPDTGIEFPETLIIPSKARLPPLSLLGLGVRSVSFLGIKVYSVGFYADLSNPGLRVSSSPQHLLSILLLMHLSRFLKVRQPTRRYATSSRMLRVS